MRIGKLVIIGVGLIGGSFALSLRRAGQVGQVVGVGRSRENLERALELGVIGNCAFSALVDKMGRIVWCCLPRFDSDSCFARLLDREHGDVPRERATVEVPEHASFVGGVQPSRRPPPVRDARIPGHA